MFECTEAAGVNWQPCHLVPGDGVSVFHFEALEIGCWSANVQIEYLSINFVQTHYYCEVVSSKVGLKVASA